MSVNYFGTDGIRGVVSQPSIDEETALHNLLIHRELSPQVGRLLGEAMARCFSSWSGQGDRVIIGWDDRPGNQHLVSELTCGLRVHGCEVIHIGLCSTPTLHHTIFTERARVGCMVTASHNPVCDSGFKIFDAYGFKTDPVMEIELSETMLHLANEDREVDEMEYNLLSQPSILKSKGWAEECHRTWLETRRKHFNTLFSHQPIFHSSNLASPFFLDCAKGFTSTWLASYLSSCGLEVIEVSQAASTLNHHCGAGDISPTQTWTFEEASQSEHVLLNRLPFCPEGMIVGAALDGDGDRCLFLVSTPSGFRVMDGDEIGALLLHACKDKEPWTCAASNESDIALTSFLTTSQPGTLVHQTAVGDRWLAHALQSSNRLTIKSPHQPRYCGIEDSGHILLAAPTNQEGEWSLVGDGAATLLVVCMAAYAHPTMNYERGWKSRVSVSPSKRERWYQNSNPYTTLSTMILDFFHEHSFNPNQHHLAGEPDALLIEGALNHQLVSIGIRNSGTQAKTSLSIRTSPGMSLSLIDPLQIQLMKALTHALQH